MDAKELMIGDWVSSRGKIEQVTNLYDGFICTDSFEDSHDYHFEPVPLSAEILENNGWKKVGEDERTGIPVMQIEYDGNAFWWTEMNGECGCEDVENEDGEEKFVKVFSCVQVCYVHELQHALRLCKIEKDIVL